MHYNVVLHPLWLAFFIIIASTTVLSINEIHVDVEKDIPTNGHWEVGCPSGYQELVSAFSCEQYGGVDLPEEELHGEKGFWTSCTVDRCLIIYHIQPEDITFAARVYQSAGQLTRLSIDDGSSFEYITGEGWIDIKRNLYMKTKVHLRIEHFSSDTFSVLDRIAINAELPPPPAISTKYTDSTVLPTSTEIRTDSTPTSTDSGVSTTTNTYGIHVDVEKDFPTNGHWEVDCPSGYQELVSAFSCEQYGGVDLPEEELHGEKGFWTSCTVDRCLIIYHIQPEDISFAARVYQSAGQLTRLSIDDGSSWEYINGEGWIDIKRNLYMKTKVHLRMEHFSSDTFSVLDRIAINAELPPPPEISTKYTDSTVLPTSTEIRTDSTPTSTDPGVSTTTNTYSSTNDDESSTLGSTLETTSETTTDEASTTPEVTTPDATVLPTSTEIQTDSTPTSTDPGVSTTTNTYEIHVDVEEDIPTNGHWDVDCPGGYQELVSAFSCDETGGVDIPREELHGEIGFWTSCRVYRCLIKYHIQPEDSTFAARIYQSDEELTGISIDDGLSWEFITGKGWVDIKRNLDVKTKVHIQMERLSSDIFSVLDRIAINAGLPPLRPGDSVAVNGHRPRLQPRDIQRRGKIFF